MEGGLRFRPDVLGLDASYMPRRYSPVWKAPLPGWKEVLDEASARMASAVLPPIFFRADNIGVASKAFDALCRLFRFYRVPLAMAVIPAWLSETRQEKVFRAAFVDEDLWNWHQHGWRHINWQKEGAKSEFGSDGPPSASTKIFFRAALKWSAFSVPISFLSLLLHGTVFPRLL